MKVKLAREIDNTAIRVCISDADPNDPVDMWLESFGDLDEVSAAPQATVRRVQTNRGELRRATQSSSDWNEEFKNAQAHAANVLKNLGNL